jgi:predicted permease
LNALLPENPEAIIYSAVFSIAMNTIAFTFGSLIISGDKKYIKVKKIFLNPAMIGAFIAIPLFILGIKLPEFLSTALSGCVTLSTPVCMFVLGIRLSAVKLSRIFTNPSAYVAIFAKQIIMPLLAIGMTLLLPFDHVWETSFIIISSCPVASVVLNLSELLGDGQKHAADCVLLGTILSIATIPIVSIFI